MSKKIVCLYIISIYILIMSTSFAATDLPYKEGEVLVRFTPKANKAQRSVSERNQFLSLHNSGTVKKTVKFIPGLCLVKLPPDTNVAETVAKLKGKGEILYVEPNYKIQWLSTIPNDTRFNELWGMHNANQTGGTVDADIDAPEAWDIIHDAEDIIVAVIDSGVDYTHPDLAENMWTDANGNHGYDFFNNNSNPYDYYGHGTHVAGIVGAKGNNGLGVTGVCWKVKLMAVKIGDEYPDTAAAIEGIEYAVNMGAKVLNASWTIGGYSQALKDSIEFANTNSVLFVAAAGNMKITDIAPVNIDIDKQYPASYDSNNIITIMATNHNDQQAYYSYYGPVSVDLAAPGGETSTYSYRGILSTIPGGYAFYQGTSMAAPHVAGACALVWAARPHLTHLEVKEAIINSVDVLPSLSGKCVSGGRLNLHKAINYWPIPSLPVILIKTADTNNCVEPFFNNTINYTIHYDPCSNTDTNVFVFDQLPNCVEYISSDPLGYYDLNSHTVIWEIPSFGPDNPGNISLTVKVNEAAAPGGHINNICYLLGDNLFTETSETTCIEVWSGDIIFVNSDANGYNNGSSWNNAYKNLQDALDAAREIESYTAIWIAKGTYKPIEDMNISDWQEYSFELIGDINIFGHFEGWESVISQRKLDDPNFETILDGQIGTESQRVITLVKSDSATNASIDSLTIKGSGSYGLHLLNDCNIAISNCTIINNQNYGIYANQNAFVDIDNCTFTDNQNTAIYSNDYSQTYITSSVFDGNAITNYGLKLYNQSKAELTDCLFINHRAGSISAEYSELSLANCDVDEATYPDAYRAIFLSYGTGTITGCLIKNSNENFNNSHGIYSINSNLTISDSSITDCASNGIIFAGCGNFRMTDSLISNNGGDGLYCSLDGSPDSLFIDRCIIVGNGAIWPGSGMRIDNVDAGTVSNNWICGNSSYGIDLSSPDGAVTIRNNTIAYNGYVGISTAGSGYSETIISNCILWNPNAHDITGSCHPSYSCIKDCYRAFGTGNICGDANDPCFVNPCTGNFHLLPNSPCINRGTDSFPDEKDIDGEDRTRDGVTDMGADEYCWPDIDLNGDEIVNLIDFSLVASGWQDTFNNTHLNMLSHDWLWGSKWGHKYDLNNDYIINFDDFAIFAKVWLYSSNYGCCDFEPDNHINNADLEILAENWLWATPLKLAQTVYIPPAQPIPNSIEEPLTCEQIDELAMWIDDMWDSNEFGGTYEEYIEFRDSIWEGSDCNDWDLDPNLWFGEGLYQTTTSESSFNSMDSMMSKQLIEDLVKWLDETWQSGDLKDAMTYEQYLDFRKDILLPFKE